MESGFYTSVDHLELFNGSFFLFGIADNFKTQTTKFELQIFVCMCGVFRSTNTGESSQTKHKDLWSLFSL